MSYTLTVTKVTNRIHFLRVLRAWNYSLPEAIQIDASINLDGGWGLPECYYDPSIVTEQLLGHAEYSYTKNSPTEEELKYMSRWEFSPYKEKLTSAKAWYFALSLDDQEKVETLISYSNQPPTG